MSVMLDPGHGGTAPGACCFGRKEKDLVMLWATLIANELEQRGHNTDWTRMGDETVSLDERVAACNDSNDVDCFVSIHCNSNDGPAGRGFEVFHHTDAPPKSRELAERIAEEWPHTFLRGVKAANYKVLRETKVPAVLIELGFINHPRESRELDSLSWAIPAADRIAEAIHEWVRQHGKHY